MAKVPWATVGPGCFISSKARNQRGIFAGSPPPLITDCGALFAVKLVQGLSDQDGDCFQLNRLSSMGLCRPSCAGVQALCERVKLDRPKMTS